MLNTTCRSSVCLATLAVGAHIASLTATYAQSAVGGAALVAQHAPAAHHPRKRAAPGMPANPFATAEQIGHFINTYRQNPQPQRWPQLFRAMTGLGLLADTESSGIYLGFIGGMLAADPAKAPAAISGLFPLPPEHQAALIKVIAYSGLPEWRALLTANAERMPSRVVLIDRFLTGRMEAFDALKLDAGPVPLDCLWGNYFATGSYESVLRIVSVLHWSADKNEVERLTIGSMAKWTLATNASSDADLLRLLKSTVPSETKANQRLLTEVIAAAETGEIATIRRDALVAIEHLKALGPSKTRSMAWWGQAGQLALSFGCVAASALGAPATIGIPCVIGGAASTAALKMWTPQ